MEYSHLTGFLTLDSVVTQVGSLLSFMPFTMKAPCTTHKTRCTAVCQKQVVGQIWLMGCGLLTLLAYFL